MVKDNLDYFRSYQRNALLAAGAGAIGLALFALAAPPLQLWNLLVTLAIGSIGVTALLWNHKRTRLVAGIVLAAAITPSLNALALGDDTAAGHGVSVTRTRVLAVLAITLLAGTATAIAGPISFVGLMVPHVVRWVVGVDQRRIVVGSIVAAPVLVLLSDIVGRVVALPAEMPVGIVTAFVGAPILVVLVRRRRRVTGL